MPNEENPYSPYEVIDVIGSGSFSKIYRVRHSHLGSVHALKILTATEETALERMLQEGRIQAQLHHRNVVSVTDVILRGKRELGLVMELIEGPNLADIIAEQGRLEMDLALRLFEQMLAGVAVAHSSGVLHRDLKPENILLATEGRKLVAKVTDFGLARPTERTNDITNIGFGMGTPGYIAPEQAVDAKAADARADIFSLGAILYEMLTGTSPFKRGGDFLATLQATRRGSYRPIEHLLPGCPKNICDAIDGALHVDPQQRFQTCDEFAYALFGEDLDQDPPSMPLDLGNLTQVSEELRASSKRKDGPGSTTLRDLIIGGSLGILLSGVTLALAKWLNLI